MIVRLGGLNTILAFLKVIGKHINSSGMLEAWVESNILGPKAAEKVLAGKFYARGIRAHKLSLQAMWRILMPQLLDFIGEKIFSCKKMLEESMQEKNLSKLISILESKNFIDVLDGFVASKESDGNFRFCWSYMEMVQILLQFIRAQRDGMWKLHIYAFQRMLPLFMRYDHTNYARWGTIYLNEMHQLPAEIKREFESGNFVVKGTGLKFNQVDPDQSQEWLNGIGKKGGGIIGITKTSTALNRWALAYNLRSHIALETRALHGVSRTDDLVHNEATKGRIKLDNQDENRLHDQLVSFGLFKTKESQSLQNIATKDIATKEIERDLLNASNDGQKQLNQFVQERLLSSDEVKFRDPLHKNKPMTFASLYEPTKSLKTGKEKEKIIRADRLVLQRLLTAYEAGRSINLPEILKHELLPVPVALAEMNGNLRTGSTAILVQAITEGISCPSCLSSVDLQNATLIIDGQALVLTIGKPTGLVTFGDLANTFVQAVLNAGAMFNRIDVVLDRYYEVSIKSATRTRRSQGTRPIRRIIEHANVPLPSNWSNFISLSENKADLARFLSQQLIVQAPNSKVIVAAGGFSSEEMVESSRSDLDTTT